MTIIKNADRLAIRAKTMLKSELARNSVQIVGYILWEVEYEGRYSGWDVTRSL